VKRLFAVDGGACSAVAVFDRVARQLVSVHVVRFDKAFEVSAQIASLPSAYPMDHVVYELPQIYPGQRQKARPNDVILTGVRTGLVVGAIVKSASPTAYVIGIEPAEWKGQMPKRVHHERVKKVLSEAEADLVQSACSKLPNGLRHNVMDAVALGLHALQRIDKTGRERGGEGT
jgi:hypothetical protein